MPPGWSDWFRIEVRLEVRRGDRLDTMTLEQRRKAVAAVKSRDTDIEMLVRRALWARGRRYRVRTNLVGRPDIVFPSKRVIVFCDGCFWHGCPTCNERPATNAAFWSAKIKSNKTRDRRVTRDLEQAGWTVLRYRGCEIRRDVAAVVADIEAHLVDDKKT